MRRLGISNIPIDSQLRSYAIHAPSSNDPMVTRVATVRYGPVPPLVGPYGARTASDRRRRRCITRATTTGNGTSERYAPIQITGYEATH